MLYKNKKTLSFLFSIICFVVMVQVIGFTSISKLPKTFAVIFQESFFWIIIYLINKYLIKQRISWKVQCSYKELFFVLFPVYLYALFAIVLIQNKGVSQAGYPFIVGIFVSFFEEYYFRGITLGVIISNISKCKKIKLYGEVWLSCLGSSIIFALTHFLNLNSQPMQLTLMQVVQTFFLGMLLNALYVRSGSLIVPMMFHFLLNFISSISTLGMSQGTLNNSYGSLLSSFFIDFVYLVFAAFLLRRKKLRNINYLVRLYKNNQ
ncbi:hypothetical protein FC65_GL000223 [Ligilactobacillus acidipiscis DSM 15836]|uniref:CAAX prenyl protease 2/Lysostaphin resistance protein A-like domain-containing protein n=1 Tax=Ligilactobacillus acidipiscis DSM 15836 TaxID=1423716 RepID=A0ABR5PJV6_9LACO|nr:CPBP family intramembrane glutamic endopeptidase [Ligilactobacillus acidipiscis]KRM25869.1 hypothetical protein FC65_GL000223 [Ligilactobacillus acidipiscis DSM 15836]GAW65201.1 CAAX amino terminal protease self-immunity family protein [Ligilactobacillus acidipiscis]GEN21554.1 hypothetical protein LAC02_48350 [Ligilactobacillus acidipiscis]